MYIPPFWVGVGATLIAEMVIVVIAAVICAGKRNKEDK